MCMYVVICKIDHCIHIHWFIPMGLGHNDPWVESHMWPQQMWGQRSSRGQWPLVQVFGKKGQCIHILWCIFKSNIILQWLQKYVIAKAGETRGSRTAFFFCNIKYGPCHNWPYTDHIIIDLYQIETLNQLEYLFYHVNPTYMYQVCNLIIYTRYPCTHLQSPVSTNFITLKHV